MADLDRRSINPDAKLRLRDLQPQPQGSTPEDSGPDQARDELTVFIPGLPKNSNARGHGNSTRWSTIRDRAKFRALAREIAEPLAEGRTPWPLTRITARHIARTATRRDPLGLAERLKGVVDGLVDANLLPDDDEDHIEVVLAHSVKSKTPPWGIQLTLERIPVQEETPA